MVSALRDVQRTVKNVNWLTLGFNVLNVSEKKAIDYLQ